MKKRAEIKEQARIGFSNKYWPVVGISLLGMVIVGAISSIPMVGGLINLLIGTIIVVGLNGFFLSVYRGHELKVESLFTPFNRYGRVLGGMLWMYLWLFLWALIFVVPFAVVLAGSFLNAVMMHGLGFLNSLDPQIMQTGMMPWANAQAWETLFSFFNPLWLLLYLLLIPAIVKSYSYFCTPYILADSPDVPATEAIKLSSKIMQGYKWKLFVTQLTFLGWFVLCGLTAGILWIFYVGPYYNAAMAGFYEEVKAVAKAQGIAGTEILR